MAVVSRISTLTVNSATGNRSWVASVASQDVAAGSAVTVTIAQTTGGTAAPAAPDSLILRMRVGASATTIISFTLTPGSASQTVTFVLTDTGAAGGSPRSGTVRMRLEAVRTSGGSLDNYNANSDDTTGQSLPAGFSVSVRNQGWLRSTTTSTVKVNKTAFADPAFTGLYAYPDSLFIRATLAAQAYDLARTITITTGAISSTIAATSGNQYDAAFPNAVTVANHPTAGVTQPQADVFEVDNSPLTGLPWTVLTTKTAQTWDVNPRLTLTQLTRTSALAKVNFGLHTVTATFGLLNARSERLNATTHGAMATLTVKSRDVAGGVNEGTANAALVPAGSPPDTYTVSWSYAGPTLTTSRGLGPNGDTAAHDLVGKAKTLTMWPNSDAGNVLVGGATIVSLSDLLQLDSHPQKSSTLNRDTNPLATPGDAETVSFIISADLLHLFCYAADVNGAPAPLVAMHRYVYDTAGSLMRSLTNYNTAADGWVSVPLTQDVLPPAGTYKTVVRVDVNHGGSGGNYGAMPAGQPDPAGSVVQMVGFGSAYTANRAPYLELPDEVALGVPAPIRGGFRAVTTFPAVVDLPPDNNIIRVDIFWLDAAGVRVSEVGFPTAMTRLGTSNVYEFVWTPLLAKTYVVEITFEYAGAGVMETELTTVRPAIVMGR